MCCCFSRVVTVLERCQQQLIQYYKATTSTIPAHPLDPSRTVAIDQFFSELELTQELEGNETTQEPIHLPEGTRNLDKVRTKPLDSWGDMFKDVVGKLRILLSGLAGFGKSTLLLRVANASTDPNSVMAKFKLVFLVKLRDMQQTSCVLEAIRDQILPNFKKAVLKKLIDDNEADTAFLLDGLDEIPLDVLNSPAPEGGYGVKDILHNKVLTRSTVLVSTRPHMVDFAIKEYPHYAHVRTLGFTIETAKKYITSYFANKYDANKRLLLISHIMSSSMMRTLAQIPIIVLFLCVVWRNLSRLPEKLTELYTEFARALVSRRRNEGEDEVELMQSVVCGLGRVALNGLLDPKGERLVFSSEEFDENDLTQDGVRLGFLQQESFTSGLREIEVVTFLHKTIQEFCAANYFANLHHQPQEFHERLQQINPDNVRAMEYLLRFACGISSGSAATGLILEHVQQQRNKGRWRDEVTLQNLVRLMLFESGSDEMADKLDRPDDAACNNQEDLLAMRYYLQCLRKPLVELTSFTFLSSSHDELVLLKDINDQLRGHTAIHPDFLITCRSQEDLKLLREILLNYNIRPDTGFVALKPFRVTYIMSEQATEEVQTLEETLEGMDERLRGQIELHLEINEMSHFDDERLLGSRVCNQIEEVKLRKRTYKDVRRLEIALYGYDGLERLTVSDTNLHGFLFIMDFLARWSLSSLTLDTCGLNDDDLPELITILHAWQRLRWLAVPGNGFSISGVAMLTARLGIRLPQLRTFHLDYSGPNAESVKQVVKRNLPNVTYV
ncbi:uncharacterized protein LOC119740073 [Patiria miniata]|uniref:NACHT domain-containing protein n=1 Tax=Patiria miniata TaxID=46514 RepID=A0A914B5I3_PATMI|nr:uncharacterized protein LOC119740073 [Patiria miniata]